MEKNNTDWKSIVIVLSIVLMLLPISATSQTSTPIPPPPLPNDYTIDTIAGTGTAGYFGDGDLAKSSQLSFPYRTAVDSSGNVYVADTNNNKIRVINPADGKISTVAGNGKPSYSGDGGAAADASLEHPYGVAVDQSGNIYIADTHNQIVRKVDVSTGTITTIAGTPDQAGSDGENVLATSAKLYRPYGIAVDQSGNIYIADTHNHKIRKVDANKIITTVAGTGEEGFSGDTGLAKLSKLSYPRGVFASGDYLYIADTGNNRVRMVNLKDGKITTLAGGFLEFDVEVDSVNIKQETGGKYSAEAIITNPGSFAREFYILTYVMEPDGSKTLARSGNEEPVKIEAGESKLVSLIAQNKAFKPATGKVDMQIELREADGKSKSIVKGVYDSGQTTELEKAKKYAGTRYGISAVNSNKNTISGNTITPWSPIDASIYLSSSEENAIQSNIISSQQPGHGILLFSANSNTMESNAVSVNGRNSNALYVKESSNIVLAADKFASAPSAAVRIKSSSVKLWNVEFRKDSILFDDESEIIISKSLPIYVKDGNTMEKISNALVEIIDKADAKVFSERLSAGEKTVRDIAESKIRGVAKAVQAP